MEQPEMHIHPRLQTKLGDLLIKKAFGRDKYVSNKKTFLVETHSEHLMLRILRRIRETTEKDFSDWSDELKKACPDGIRPEDVAVIYVEPSKEGVTIKELRINHHGEFIDEWPQGFFEERINEVF